MLERVKWTDNTCTVKETCFTMLADGEGMQVLLDYIPDGRFTNCFHWPGFTYKSPQPSDHTAAFGKNLRSYYFTCREDAPRFNELFVRLRLEGNTLRRGEGSW